MLLLGGFP